MPLDFPQGAANSSAEELRRIAFGPSSTEEARAAATRELARRATEAERADKSESAVETAVETAVEPEVEPAPTEDPVASADEVAAPRARRSIPLVWVLPIVIVSLVVGAIAGGALGPAAAPRAPATASDAVNGSQPLRGNLDAARAQLAAASSATAFPDPGFVDGQGLESVIQVGDDHFNDLHITVWGATNASNDICLIAGVPDGVFASQCVTAREFVKRGITLGFNGFEVSWDGVSTSEVPSTSGPGAAGPSASQETVPVVGRDTNLPLGDLDSARTLFAAAASEQVTYPHPALLSGLRESTVRYLGGDRELVRAWVAEDRAGGICLLLDQNGKGAVHCSTASDFVARGIAVGIGEYSVSWNGRDWASSSPSGYRQGISTPAAG